MEADALARWVEAYRRAWESNDPDEIGALFADDARYFTEPFAEPWTGRETIVRSWLERKDEVGDTEFRYQIAAVCDDVGFVRGWTRYFTPPPREYSNLWVVRPAEDGRCQEFTEWW